MKFLTITGIYERLQCSLVCCFVQFWGSWSQQKSGFKKFMPFSYIKTGYPPMQFRNPGNEKIASWKYIIYIKYHFIFDEIEYCDKLYMKVKRGDHTDKRRPVKTWIENIISSNLLGKIGTELLIESYGSFFSPYAVGMACLRSEVLSSFIRHYLVKLQYLELDRTV